MGPVQVRARRARLATVGVVAAVVATIFATIAVPTTAGAATTFTDVPEGHPFHDEIEWLADSGITTGFGDGTFRPAGNITRQAMAAFFFRYEQPTGFTAPAVASFSDVPTTHPFFEEIEWMSHEEIAGGFTDGTFRPTTAVSRQATAAFLHRLAGL